MQQATIRRLLVFGVCLVGVGFLYLVPSMAGSGSVGSSPRHDLQTSPAPTPVQTAAETIGPTPTGQVTSRTAGPEVAPSGTAAVSSSAPAHETVRRTRQPGRAAATAAPPGSDEHPPAAVGRLAVLSTDPDELVVRWDEPQDDIGVVGYRVLVNGFVVQTTQQTRATLAWFNDTNTHVVQVRAIDAAGNEGPSSPTLLVTRPAPAPEPATPTPSVSPVPTPSEVTGQTPDTKDAAPPPATTSPEGSPKESDS